MLTRSIVVSLLAAACGARPGGGQLPPNVLVVTIDTLRADHLSCYGYFRDTSPNIDALAAESILFEQCLAPTSHTLPSHASLFTGTHPIEHGVRANPWRVEGVPTGHRFASTPSLLTLAEHLSGQGYETAGFVSAAPVNRASGIAAGFATWSEPEGFVRAGMETEAEAEAWLGRERERPFFAWVHLFDCHQLYTELPEEFAQLYATDEALITRLEEREAELEVTQRMVEADPDMDGQDLLRLISVYDGSIRYADEIVGRLIDGLRERGQLERTLVLLTGDHGEGLGQHGWHEHGGMWREQLHVPLILRVPGLAPARIDVPLSLVDVLPTFFGLAEDLPVQGFLAQCSGRDVLATDPRGLLGMRPRETKNRGWVIERDGWRFHMTEKGAEALYHLERDPFELFNALEHDPERASELRELLLASRDRLRERGARVAAERRELGISTAVDEEHIEGLEALGYTGE